MPGRSNWSDFARGSEAIKTPLVPPSDGQERPTGQSEVDGQ